MDPNETLRRLRDFVAEALEGKGFSSEAAELFEALDQWLTKGGSPPDDWARLRGDEAVDLISNTDLPTRRRRSSSRVPSEVVRLELGICPTCGGCGIVKP